MSQDRLKEKRDEKIKSESRHPRRYNVVFFNDNITTADFVVYLAIKVFKKSQQEAQTIMVTVDQKGKALVGTYSKDIAMTKVKEATDLAKEENFPFVVTMEPAE